MATKGKTAKQDTALALLASGPLTVGEALALGGPVLVAALRQLTCQKGAPVMYVGGKYVRGGLPSVAIPGPAVVTDGLARVDEYLRAKGDR